jgi:hypothetical protein
MRILAQQLDAEVGFQLRQLAADGGFGHSEQCRRLREAAAFHHLAENQQGIEVERRFCSMGCVPKYATGCCALGPVLTISATVTVSARRAHE